VSRILTSTVLIAAALGCATATAQYAAAPFHVQALEPARALVESVRINNWLHQNYSRMDQRQTQGAREHLHALIDAQVKQSYAKQNVFEPPRPDDTLAILYSWAGRLGVYGADLVYTAVKGTYPVPVIPSPRPPPGFDISLIRESLLLSSADGQWRATVPFHFFIFTVNTSAPGVKKTEFIVISTGTAPDAAPPGYSQATIALVFVHGGGGAEFEREWAERLQIPMNAALNPIGFTRYRSRAAYDSATRIHKELVYAPTAKGAFAIFYSGLDGTYQTNRPHFLDFMRMVQLPP
jgi:hypothetical protein